MENPEAIYFLLSRYLSGDATEAESARLLKALQEDPQLMWQFDLLQQVWTAGNPLPAVPPGTDKIQRILQLAAVQQLLSPGDQETTDKNLSLTEAADPGEASLPATDASLHWQDLHKAAIARRRRARWRAGALLACLLLAAGALHYWQNRSSQAAPNEVVSLKGSKTRTLLPDGSTVWLNAGSSIEYTGNLSGPLRELTLVGEAFFDIVPQPNRPFIVHTGTIDIKVLGTAFNVKSYADDPTVETTLLRGMVQVSRVGVLSGTPMVLHPHQKIVLQKQLVKLPDAALQEQSTTQRLSLPAPTIIQLDSALREQELLETAWVYNRLQFRGDDFPGLARKLERWYNINIHFVDAAVQSLTFNGSLENETVEQAFRALQAAASFDYSIKGNDVFINSRKPAAP
ncbi:MAG: FecR family protein [Candidatus Pseudobacter hemicellulosilyticus]|uniref:FecR family protein n=1 Tax=Candidatus Pseudobacter hemicellulosilyticus TaxID=3121375 RepID=A0AAJ6BEE4_9BACT|nr:MAG: FecR family protein [Pseudobacter sp.]